MNQIFMYSQSGVTSLMEPSVADKRARVKEAINQAIDAYRRHSVFTVAVSKKGVGGFDCFVVPRSADWPRGMNPAAYHSCLIWKSHWRAVPEKMLDQIEKWYF